MADAKRLVDIRRRWIERTGYYNARHVIPGHELLAQDLGCTVEELQAAMNYHGAPLTRTEEKDGRYTIMLDGETGEAKWACIAGSEPETFLTTEEAAAALGVGVARVRQLRETLLWEGEERRGRMYTARPDRVWERVGRKHRDEGRRFTGEQVALLRTWARIVQGRGGLKEAHTALVGVELELFGETGGTDLETARRWSKWEHAPHGERQVRALLELDGRAREGGRQAAKP
jgi:hypothetical protein